MRYDLKLIHELCQELGLRSRVQSDALLDIELGDDCVLFFQNTEGEDDCMVGFHGTTPWHSHGDFIFADCRGYFAELSYLDVISGLKEGIILICERWIDDRLLDRWLIHRDFNNEFKYMDEREEVRVRRPVISVIRHETVA